NDASRSSLLVGWLQTRSMQLSYYFKIASGLVQSFARQPRQTMQVLRGVPSILRGYTKARDWRQADTTTEANVETETESTNPVRNYFESHTKGRGIWKWEHYFDIYQRHFQKFVGQEVHVVEVGIYSGGSLDMWKNYFGPKCQVC